MARYHPRYRVSEDPEHGFRRPQSKAPPKRERLCRRPPARFVLVWIGLTFLLSINFFTLSRERQPSRSRWVGWQAWQSLGVSRKHVDPLQTSFDGLLDGQGSSAGSTFGDESSQSMDLSFPLDIFAPLVPNPAPLTDVTVESCFPFTLDRCRPRSTPQEDALLGKWVLVPRPLDSETAMSSSLKQAGIHGALDKLFGVFETRYLFYRRSLKNGVPRVVDLKLIEAGDELPNGGLDAGWRRVKHDLRTKYMRVWGGQKTLHLYVRRFDGRNRPTVRQADNTSKPDVEEAITELEVTYGEDNPPWPGFFRVGRIVSSDKATGHSASWLTARRKPPRNPPIDAHPKFRADGRFKILQIADLHFSVEEEPCRDVKWEEPSKPCHSANDTLKMVEGWLDEEKPDLVVLTGDQLNGQGTTWDPKSVMPKFVKPIIDRKIQWAAILGNHDSQSGPLSRPEIQLLLSRMPYSLSRVGPSELHDGVGAGNYYIKLDSPTPDRTNVMNLYFLDSGDAAPKSTWQPWTWMGYDWVRQDQVNWFLKVSGGVKAILRPYKPDGGVDLPKQDWSSRDDAPTSWDAHSAQGSTLAKPPAIAFVHIPSPGFFENDLTTRKFGPDRGESSGRKGAQKHGLFFDAIVGQGAARDVRLIVSGHMHNNADCEEIVRGAQKVWTCFGGGSSYAGYGKAGFSRRSRVFDITNFGNTAESWSRLEDGSKAYNGVLWDERSNVPS